MARIKTGTQDALFEIIKEAEGFRAKAYLDALGYGTIGYGHLLTPEDAELARKTLTKQDAETLLREDIREHQSGALKNIKRPLSNNQMAALTSLAFNLGKNHPNLKKIVGMVNEGKLAEATDYMLRLDKGKEKQTGKWVSLTPLKDRREFEKKLFLLSDGDELDLEIYVSGKKKDMLVSRSPKSQDQAAGKSQASSTAPATQPSRKTTNS